MPAPTSVAALLERYETVLIDAYGVLVTDSAALPGAHALVQRLEAERRPWYVVTNAASSLPESLAARFAALGVPVPAERVITSGSLISRHFSAHGLAGYRCAVLGPADSWAYVRRAGGEPVSPETPFDALCICDEDGIDFLTAANAALSGVIRGLDAGREVPLILTNPDIIYPAGDGAFAFTAGALALLIERGLTLRYAEPPTFTVLGKPEPAIFHEALRRAGSDNAVMIGDQRHTDILGAQRAGIDSALVTSGVAGTRSHPELPEPTWYLPGLTQ